MDLHINSKPAISSNKYFHTRTSKELIHVRLNPLSLFTFSTQKQQLGIQDRPLPCFYSKQSPVMANTLHKIPHIT